MDSNRTRGVFPWEREDQITSLVKQVSISMRREIERALRPLGLTPQQGQALRVLSCCPGSTHSDVERILNIEKPSVTSLINGMEAKGWVLRRQHPADARVKQIYLTEAGSALVEQSIVLVEQIKDRFNSTLSEEEAALMKVLLKKILRAYE
jgi:DNA-binding MarR family transcriptional regulator